MYLRMIRERWIVIKEDKTKEVIRSIVRRKRNITPLLGATPTSPSQVLCHQVTEVLLVGCPQPKIGIGVG